MYSTRAAAGGSERAGAAAAGDRALPRGPHKLPREAVRASQRERLVRAMLRVVAAEGYAATTVPKVAAAARVSPNAFYSLFRDKADCFLAACDEDVDELLGELFATADEDGWVASVRKGTRVYLEWWRDRPETTRAYCIEMAAAGERAVAQRHETFDRFVAMFTAVAARARAEQPGLPPVSEFALRVHTAGLTDVVAQEVRAGRLDRLVELEDELVHLTVRLLADDATADRAIGRGG